jgi:hypothetical protein
MYVKTGQDWSKELLIIQERITFPTSSDFTILITRTRNYLLIVHLYQRHKFQIFQNFPTFSSKPPFPTFAVKWTSYISIRSCDTLVRVRIRYLFTGSYVLVLYESPTSTRRLRTVPTFVPGYVPGNDPSSGTSLFRSKEIPSYYT